MLSLPKYLLPLAFLFAVADHAAAAPPEDERARNAVRVLSEIQKIPEQAIPDKPSWTRPARSWWSRTRSRPAWCSADAAATA